MVKTNKKSIFISWTPFNPHSSLLNEAFNSNIFYIHNLINSRGILWKIFFLVDYIYKSIKTITIIIKYRPNLIVIQNPPSLVPLVIVLFSYFKRYKTVVDSHNGAFEAPWASVPLYRWSLRNADIVIVHNNQIYKRLSSNTKYNGINFKILNSRLSDFNNIKKEDSIDTPYFLVVSTFAGDEPMEVLMEGLKLYLEKDPIDLIFKLTGSYNKKKLLYDEYKNYHKIKFLGFVSNEQYKQLMLNAFGIISLSSRDDVQQFALMESIGAEVPFISNENITNKDLFGDKMILVEITPEKIAAGIEDFIKNKDKLDKNVKELKLRILAKWEKDFNLIKSELSIRENA